jgi:hypothetical protein
MDYLRYLLWQTPSDAFWTILAVSVGIGWLGGLIGEWFQHLAYRQPKLPLLPKRARPSRERRVPLCHPRPLKEIGQIPVDRKAVDLRAS